MLSGASVGGGPRAGKARAARLTSGLPGGTAILVAGYSQANAPLLGGVLVPTPAIVVPGIPLDATGAWTLALDWPALLASGFAIYAQAWIPDPAGPQGFAASNGLRITTQ
jgi:hypothetical protein